MENFRNVIYQLISDKIGVDKTVLTDSTDFYDDLGVDSLDFIELMADIEVSLGIVIEEEVYEKLKTVGTLIKQVEKKLKARMNQLPV